MGTNLRKVMGVVVLLACVAVIAAGMMSQRAFLGNAVAAIGLCLWGITLVPFRRRRNRDNRSRRARETGGRQDTPSREPEQDATLAAAAAPASADHDSSSLVEAMFGQDRFALLLRPQIIDNLQPDQQEAAVERLDEAMSLVPEGDVLMRVPFRHVRSDRQETPDRTVRVEAFYLDRYPVTNAEFAKFVAAGGYEQMSLWEADALAGLLDFVDTTGKPGPSLWRDGRPLPGTERHPVVGVSWYEAAAYARWVGKRLPTDPEWVKAGGWPVASGQGKPVQRAYPWGDTMDRHRANLWRVESASTVPVDAFDEGDTVGGIRQMIGNVWEWMHSDFGQWDAEAEELVLAQPMKGLRGGAFDTYFDLQASCDFYSGDNLLARRSNISFRCAIGLCDLAIDRVLGGFTNELEEGGAHV